MMIIIYWIQYQRGPEIVSFGKNGIEPWHVLAAFNACLRSYADDDRRD